MRMAVRHYAEQEGPIYAECGGLMYLTEAIRDAEDRRHEMVGLFPAESVMRTAGMTLGYRTVEVSRPCLLGPAGASLRGHEFHYSRLEPKGRLHYACSLSDAEGRLVGQDGLVVHNTLAMYSHLHFASRPEAVASLLTQSRGLRTAPHSVDM
jgi:cobyrinic acid a,c-diamide synthase